MSKTKLELENRIEKLRARGLYNTPLIKKLERRLRKMEEQK